MDRRRVPRLFQIFCIGYMGEVEDGLLRETDGISDSWMTGIIKII